VDQAKSVRIARDSVPVDKAALQTAVSGANTNKETAVVSIDGSDVDQDNHWVTQVEMTAYGTAISNAQEVLGKADATQGEVDAQVTALNEATTTFNNAKKSGTKVEIKSVAATTVYLSGNSTVDAGLSGNTITIGGTIPKYSDSILGHKANSNLFEVKITLDNVNKETAACKIVGSDPDKPNIYPAEDNWIDDPEGNYFYFVGAVKDISSTFTITIDKDGIWATTGDAVSYNVVIVEGTILGQ